MVDGSQQGFCCFVGGKKIKIKTSLSNSIGGKTLRMRHVRGKNKKKTKKKKNKQTYKESI